MALILNGGARTVTRRQVEKTDEAMPAVNAPVDSFFLIQGNQLRILTA